MFGESEPTTGRSRALASSGNTRALNIRSRFASMILNIRAAPTNPYPRSHGQSPGLGGTDRSSSDCATLAGTDEKQVAAQLGSQDSLRDLFAQVFGRRARDRK